MQIKFKGIKKTAKIAGLVVAIVTLFFVAGAIWLSTDKAQNFIIQTITSEIEEQTGIAIDIEKFSLRFPNKILLQNAKINIPEYNQLLQATELQFNVSLTRLLRRKIVSDYLKIKGVAFQIHLRADGTSNIDFLKNMQMSGNGVRRIRIRSVILEDCAFRFDNDKFAQKNSELFDANHFALEHINAEIALDEYRKNTLRASIKELNFAETKGLRLNHLETEIALDEQQLTLPRFIVEANASRIETDTIRLKFNALSDLKTAQQNVTITATLNPSVVALSDFKSFAPDLANFRKTVNLSGELSGTLDSLALGNFAMSYGNDIQLQGALCLTNLAAHELDKIHVDAAINQLSSSTLGIQDVIASAQKKPFLLPAEIHNLGHCNYSGTIHGVLHDLHLHGALQTNIGTVKTNVTLAVTNQFNDVNINGEIASKNLHLKKLLPHVPIGDISFNITANAQLGTNKPFYGNAVAKIEDLLFRDYRYQNLTLDGEFKLHFFGGHIMFNDPNGKLVAEGAFDWNKDFPKFKFVADVADFAPYKMNLTTAYPDLTFNVKANADFAGGDLDNANGFFELFDINLTNGEKMYSLAEIKLTSEEISEQTNQITLQSDVANGYITGSFILRTLKNSLLNSLKKHLPSYIKNDYETAQLNNFIYKLNIVRLNELTDFLDIKWTTNDSIDLFGSYNDAEDDINLTLSIPSVIKKGGRTSFRNINLNLGNTADEIALRATATVVAPKYTTVVNSNVQLSNDSLRTFIDWSSNKAQLFEGELFALTSFSATNDTLGSVTDIYPTQFVLRDSVWSIAPAQIATDFATVAISNFGITKADQYLTINGTASTSETDTLDIQLRNIDLSYISGFIPKASVAFSGEATGNASVSNTFTKPIFNAEVLVPEFSFNNALWGKVEASSAWNFEKNALDLKGLVTNQQKTIANITGGYFFGNDSLDLIGSANDLDISFINYYLNDITLSAAGRASGDVHVFGKKKEITVTAQAKADDARLTVDYLKTTYSFSDSIILKPDSILFRNIAISDQNNNHGKVDGYVAHNYFKNFEYDIDIECDNMMAMNTHESDNPDFYGLIFATGDVEISGSDATGTTISARAATDQKTKVFIPMSNTASAMDNSFVVFVNDTVANQNTIAPPETQSSNLKLAFMIEVTPDAEAQIIINPTTGDMIKATGEGNLKVEFDLNTNEFKLYGDYTLETGQYLFSLQNALRKEFRIQKGSTLRWVGRPEDADVNITAFYQLTASLADILDKSTLANSNRTSVPVQCVLNLTGSLMRPNIAFDLNLPNSDEELNRALKSVINTEEMMNRQIVYLLALGKFFTPEYLRTNTQSELLAIASSTLSSQLNNWASQLFEDWNFGVNFRTSGEGDDKSNEYEFAFLYSPNDRLVINGNLGYRDDNLSASKFIGDVDAEYKITSNGKIWLRAYNHTNDYKEFKTALTTQGVGLVYRENFSSGKALIKDWQRTIKRNKEERAARKQQRKERKEQRRAEKEAKRQLKESKK